jgi:hypothetical protein
LALLLACATALHAQTPPVLERGRLRILVVDHATGRPLENSLIELTREGGLRGGAVNAEGIVTIDPVSAGSWQVRVRHIGYHALIDTISFDPAVGYSAVAKLKIAPTHGEAPTYFGLQPGVDTLYPPRRKVEAQDQVIRVGDLLPLGGDIDTMVLGGIEPKVKGPEAPVRFSPQTVAAIHAAFVKGAMATRYGRPDGSPNCYRIRESNRVAFRNPPAELFPFLDSLRILRTSTCPAEPPMILVRRDSTGTLRTISPPADAVYPEFIDLESFSPWNENSVKAWMSVHKRGNGQTLQCTAVRESPAHPWQVGCKTVGMFAS